MKFTVSGHDRTAAPALQLRCPHCGHASTFTSIANESHDFHIGGNVVCGQRKCSAPGCNGHLFIARQNLEVLAAYPASTIDFDAKDIPPNIVASFDEALRSHAVGCYMASALLVRRTLEEICSNKGATGKDLKARLADLRGKIVVPEELFNAMDELRLLGNDAAHIEAKSYDKISQEEIEVAIEFTKEFLKALYQYGSLLAKLRGLKKTS